MSGGPRRRASSRLGLLGGGADCALLVAGTASSAHATAILTTTTPAPSATATRIPVAVSATFDDGSPVLTESRLSIDGTTVPATFSYPVGYWDEYYDDYEEEWIWYWEVTDSTVGRLDYSSSSPLRRGPQRDCDGGQLAPGDDEPRLVFLGVGRAHHQRGHPG